MNRWVAGLSLHYLAPPSLQDHAHLLRDGGASSAIGFRFWYAMAFQTPVLTPLLILGAGSEEVAVLSLVVARLTMLVAEFPSGILADRWGSRRCAQVGLVALLADMVGFFSLLTAAAQGTVDQTVMAAGVIGLQVLFGVGLALMSGADTVAFLDGLRAPLPPNARDDLGLEAFGSSVRYAGSSVAVCVGALAFASSQLFHLTEATTGFAHGLVFLGTGVAYALALRSLSHLASPAQTDIPSPNVPEPPPIVEQVAGTLRIWRRLLSQRPGRFLLAVGLLAAVAQVCHYLLQKPLADVGDLFGAARVVPVGFLWPILFAAAHTAGSLMTLRGARRTYGWLALRGRRRRRLPLVILGVGVASVLMAWAAPPDHVAVYLFPLLLFVMGLRGFASTLNAAAIEALVRRADGEEENAEHRASALSLSNTVVGGAFALVAGGVAYSGSSLTGSMVLVFGGASLVVAGLVGASWLVVGWQRAEVVVIGSYRRDFEGLLEVRRALAEREGLVVSHPPAETVVTGEDSGFVRLSTDTSREVGQVQGKVLKKIRAAKAVVLFAPDQHVGTSAALEVGFALAHGIPVVSIGKPADVTISALVHEVVGDADQAADAIFRLDLEEPRRG